MSELVGCCHNRLNIHHQVIVCMGVHNNVHIPSESWPHWTWYAIEMGIVMAVSMLVARTVTDSIEGLAADQQNWIFYGIVGGIFLAWYIVIRSLVLKKPILENRY